MPTTRRLAAILAADVAGYSRLIETDEQGTLERLRAIRSELIDPRIAAHNGRTVKTTGDGFLAEFGSTVDALQCAQEVQAQMANRNLAVAPESRIDYRIGIHQGDIVVETDGDIFGDGVNIAARLEGLADPGGVCVSSRVQEDAVGKLVLDFRDLGEQNLKNITRPVRAFAVQPRTEATKSAEAKPLPLPDKPSIAVLPFQNMSGDPEQEYFVDGMVEEIITALSRIRWLFVIARNSSFTYKGQAVDVKRVGRELGVRYVLEGSVRKAANRLRITAQLIEAQTGTHLWADRFDGLTENVFELQDNVAFSAAGVIESTLQAAEIQRSSERPTSDLTAYDLYLRALPNCLSWDRERIISALDLLQQAIARDPNFGPALGFAAVCHHHLSTIGGLGDPEVHRRATLDYAQRALRASPSDPGTITNVAFMFGYFGEDIEPAITLIDRALGINPSFYRGWGISGWLRLWAGHLDVAVEHLQTAIRLSPLYGNAGNLYGIGVAHFLQGQFDEAISELLTALGELPGHAGIYRYLASCYAHARRLEDAREIVRRLRAITPNVAPNVVQWRKPEHRELFLSGLQMASGGAT